MGDDKMMAEITIPAEMSYTMAYMSMIAYSGMGKNA